MTKTWRIGQWTSHADCRQVGQWTSLSDTIISVFVHFHEFPIWPIDTMNVYDMFITHNSTNGSSFQWADRQHVYSKYGRWLNYSSQFFFSTGHVFIFYHPPVYIVPIWKHPQSIWSIESGFQGLRYCGVQKCGYQDYQVF